MFYKPVGGEGFYIRIRFEFKRPRLSKEIPPELKYREARGQFPISISFIMRLRILRKQSCEEGNQV